MDFADYVSKNLKKRGKLKVNDSAIRDEMLETRKEEESLI